MEYFLLALISIAGYPKALVWDLSYLLSIHLNCLTLKKDLPCVYCFAELCVSFKPDGQVSQDAAMRAMERCTAYLMLTKVRCC